MQDQDFYKFSLSQKGYRCFLAASCAFFTFCHIVFFSNIGVASCSPMPGTQVGDLVIVEIPASIAAKYDLKLPDTETTFEIATRVVKSFDNNFFIQGDFLTKKEEQTWVFWIHAPIDLEKIPSNRRIPLDPQMAEKTRLIYKSYETHLLYRNEGRGCFLPF